MKRITWQDYKEDTLILGKHKETEELALLYYDEACIFWDIFSFKDGRVNKKSTNVDDYVGNNYDFISVLNKKDFKKLINKKKKHM